VTQAIPAGLGAKNARVRLEDCQFNWQIPRSFRGDDYYFQQMEFCSFKNCRTPEGYVSEQNGEATLDAAGFVEIPTKLMWEPKQLQITGPVTSWSWKVTYLPPPYNNTVWHRQQPALRVNGTPGARIVWTAVLSP
jgi:hypothetical protein